MPRTTYASIDLVEARKLADLISDAVSSLESLASKSDDLFVSSNKEKQEEEEAKEARTPMLTLVSAAGQLMANVRPPNVVAMDLATSHTLSSAIRLATDASIPELIRSISLSSPNLNSNEENDTRLLNDSKGVSVGEMNKLTGIEVGRLSRILRLLATYHVFRECPPLPGTEKNSPANDRFAHTRISLAMDSGAPLEEIIPCFSEAKDEDDLEGVRRRWKAKYGREGKGAALAALVGLLSDDSAHHQLGLSEALLATSRPPFTVFGFPRAEEKESISNLKMDDPMRAAFNFARFVPPSAIPQGRKASTKDSNTSNSSSTPNGLTTTKKPERGQEVDTTVETMYTWLSLPQNAHRLHRFGCAMKAIGDTTPEGAILSGFNFDALPTDAIVLDVGGGLGSTSLPILRAHPHLRLVIQDTEEVVKFGPDYWKTNYPEALSSNRVAFQKHNFFDPQPPLPFSSSSPSPDGKSTPDVILMRMIMHNWPDAECGAILRHARRAAGEKTRLVVVDSVLTPAYRLESEESSDPTTEGEEGTKEKDGMKAHGEAPEPLLANWGVANGGAYRLDLIMMCNHNASERTIGAFDALLRKNGWKVEALHSASESWMPQIIAIPAEIPSPSILEPATTEREEVAVGDASYPAAENNVKDSTTDKDKKSGKGSSTKDEEGKRVRKTKSRTEKLKDRECVIM